MRLRRLLGYNLLTAVVLGLVGFYVGWWLGHQVKGKSLDYFGDTGQNDIALFLAYLTGVVGFLVGLGFASYPLQRLLGKPPSLREKETTGPGRYFGTDILQELLDYARVGCPESWQFACVEDIRIPFPDDCADFASFFSVFTHLLHEESYCYLLEARRVVKAGGTIVFSFLEYEDNWPVFENAYTALLNGEMTVHLNMFIHRDVIAAWAQRLGMSVVDMRGANEPFVELTRPVVYDDGHCAEGVAPLGQSVCVLRNDKPAPDGRSTFRSYETSYRVV